MSSLSSLSSLLLAACLLSSSAALADEAPASQPAQVDDEAAPASQPADAEEIAAASQPAQTAAPASTEDEFSVTTHVIPWITVGVGIAAMVLGAVLGPMGLIPAFQVQMTQGELATIQGRVPRDGDDVLIADLQDQAYQQNQSWQAWGAPLVAASLALLMSGGLMAAGGVYTGIKGLHVE